jgi:hypothetical protein
MDETIMAVARITPTCNVAKAVLASLIPIFLER